MPARVTLSNSRVKTLRKQIIACGEKANEIWFGRTKFSIKHEDRLREEIRNIDEIREVLFYQLWEVYENYPDEVEFLDEYKSFDKKTRWLFCDGKLHFVTDKKENLLYGYNCDCEEVE